MKTILNMNGVANFVKHSNWPDVESSEVSHERVNDARPRFSIIAANILLFLSTSSALSQPNSKKNGAICTVSESVAIVFRILFRSDEVHCCISPLRIAFK